MAIRGSGGISRRAFVGRALAGSALLAAGGWQQVARALTAPPGTLADPAGLPSAAAFRRMVGEMTAHGPRLPGTPAHRAFVDGLEAGFRSAGLTVTRDTHTFTQWLPRRFSLELLEGAQRGRVPVASYYTYSGVTPPRGATGELVYAGLAPSPSVPGDWLDLTADRAALERFQGEAAADVAATLAAIPGGVQGRIVVMDAPVAPLTVGAFDPVLTYRHDPDHTIGPTSDYKRTWTTLLTLPQLAPFKQAGAAGVVFALDADPADAHGQYTPFIWPLQDLPALIVDRDVGRLLRRRAGARPRARMVLDAAVTQNVPSDSLVAVLPGDGSSDELMIVNTHTDGMNAFEENAGVAAVALARYFSRLPRSARRRTLVFSCVTGHFGPGLPQTQGFIDDHPDLIKRAAAAITIEHFGAREWLDDLRRGYRSTGRVELGVAFHSQTPVAAPAIDALRAVDLRRTELMRPIGPTFFGVGASLHEAGVPSVAYIAGPNYLLALARNAHLDKLDPARYRRETLWTADLLQRLDRVPAAVLKTGDSGVLALGHGNLPIAIP